MIVRTVAIGRGHSPEDALRKARAARAGGYKSWHRSWFRRIHLIDTRDNYHRWTATIPVWRRVDENAAH